MPPSCSAPSIFCPIAPKPNVVQFCTYGEVEMRSGLDWHSWGGNGILWPYVGKGGASIFIGANSGMSTGVIGSLWITVCTLEWDKLVVNPFSD